MRIAVEMLAAKADFQQHLHRLGAPFFRRHIGVEQQRLCQYITDLLARVERTIRVLEHDLHLLAHFSRQPIASDVHILAADLQFAGSLRIDHGENAGQRGLPATRFADNCQRLSLLHLEAHALDCMNHFRLAEQPATDMIIALDIARFENNLAHRASPAPVFSKTKSETVGRRSPVAFSGKADSSARV